MLNIEKYATEMKEKFSEVGDIGASVFSIYRLRGLRDSYNYVFTAEEVFDWLLSEYKEPLISETERNYLRDLKKWYKFDAIKVSFLYIDLLVQGASGGGLTRYECVYTIPYAKGGPKFEGLKNSDQIVYTLEELQV